MSRHSPERLIFLLQTHTPWGGMELWVDELSGFLTERGWKVFAGLAKGHRFSDPDHYLEHHPRLSPVIMDAAAGTESARVEAVSKAIRKTGAAIAIPVGIGAAFTVARILKSGGTDLRLVVPLQSMFADSVANVLDEADSVDAVVVNARLLQRFLSPRLPDPSRVHYVFQGVRPPVLPPIGRAAFLRAGFVGRLEQSSKRIFDFASLEDELGSASPVHLHLWGDGPDGPELRSRLHRAVVHGYRSKDDLYREAYPELDALVLFSETEGSPNVVWEAMHHGVVPVVSDFLGQRSEGLLRHGENALIFPVGELALAAQHLRTLATDRALLERLSQRARNDMAGRTDRAMYEAWDSVLRQVAARPPLRPAKAFTPVGTGRLDRVLPSQLADRLRSLLGRRFKHPEGWSEWPGTLPVEPERAREIEEELQRIDSRDAGLTPTY